MEEEKLQQQAINAALLSDWKKAVELNQKILEKLPEEIDTINRLGYAFIKLGKIKQARYYFRKTLSIDRFNPMANKNLQRLKRLKQIKPQKDGLIVSPTLFLEESGKTKSIVLVKIATQKTLSSLSIGQNVTLSSKGYSIEIRTEDKTYLGTIPDNLSFRLKKLIHKGYQYEALIKNVKENFLSIFLREVKKGKGLKGQPSFSPGENKTYFPSLKKQV
ncbi:hypothetical protein ISS85_00235 [Candidatus Microgenomates bacterium]|nr:hypothetical protein [Candidatus Microgenomates bacterium]